MMLNGIPCWHHLPQTLHMLSRMQVSSWSGSIKCLCLTADAWSACGLNIEEIAICTVLTIVNRAPIECQNKRLHQNRQQEATQPIFGLAIFLLRVELEAIGKTAKQSLESVGATSKKIQPE